MARAFYLNERVWARVRREKQTLALWEWDRCVVDSFYGTRRCDKVVAVGRWFYTVNCALGDAVRQSGGPLARMEVDFCRESEGMNVGARVELPPFKRARLVLTLKQG